LTWLSPPQAADEVFSAQINHAETTLQNKSYLLSANIVYRLSPKAMEALQNGVPLFWQVRIKVTQARFFLWNKTLSESTIRYHLDYHALLNMFRVRNETTGEIHNFSTLSAALDLMSAVRDFPVINQADVDTDTPTNVAIKVDFDPEALPLPLRTVAYLNREWYLSSEWTVWPLKK
jgi:hypothetical protein